MSYKTPENALKSNQIYSVVWIIRYLVYMYTLCVFDFGTGLIGGD